MPETVTPLPHDGAMPADRSPMKPHAQQATVVACARCAATFIDWFREDPDLVAASAHACGWRAVGDESRCPDCRNANQSVIH